MEQLLGVPGWLGTASWSFYADLPYAPPDNPNPPDYPNHMSGDLLFFGNQAGTRVVDPAYPVVDRSGWGPSTLYMHELAVDVNLPAGTYWFSWFNGSVADYQDRILTAFNYAWYAWPSSPNTSTTECAFDIIYRDNPTPNFVGYLPWYDAEPSSCAFAFQLLGTVPGTSPGTDVVPEPATLTLLATGLAGLAAARRRKTPVVSIVP